jgi:inorganic triphosphatase YgiF
MEVEAKFAVPNAEVAARVRRARALGPFPLEPTELRTLHDVYLDTDERRIWRSGYALRLRHRDAEHLATLKSLRGGAGHVKRREEVEVELPGPLLPAGWPAGPLRERVLGMAEGAPLKPLFDLHQRRWVRTITAEGRVLVELSLDEVRMERGNRKERFRMLEVELLSGTEEEFHVILALVGEVWQLEPDRRPKLERAIAFFDLDLPIPTPDRP